MPEPLLCPRCRTPLDASDAAGPCPRCAAGPSPLSTGAYTPHPSQEDQPTAETKHPAAGVTVREEPPPLGRIGRFQLRAVLGQGGFGRVYRAHDPQLDREVALKVPRFAPDEPEQVERFLGEAKAAARLRHPNLVAVFESGRDGDDYYIVSEFVEGLPLSERLRHDPPDFRQAAAWVRDLARALAYAHGEGIIHRDIKSANVLIDRDGRPQLTDFGLAKRVGEDATRTADGAVLGTPAYMAPEQARGDGAAVGPHSDQFSLGVVLYELLARRLPFDGPAHALLLQVLADDPPPPSRFNPAVPRDLEAICLKAMAKEPARRYGGAAELADDLDRYLAGAPIRARRPGLRERAGRWLRRRRHVVFLIAGVTAAVVVTLAAVWWGGGFRPPPPPLATEAGEGPPPDSAPNPGLVEQTDIQVRAGNLRSIGMAIQAYQANFSYLPQPAIYDKSGAPLLSWRVAILPFMGQDALYKKFHLDEPWDSPHNLELLQQAEMPKAYEARGASPPKPYMTYYKAVVGPGAVFEPDPRRHIRQAADVRGPQDHTLLLAEAAEPVEWTRPTDLVVEPNQPLPRFGGLSPDGFLICFVDGSVQFLKQELSRDDAKMRALISRNGDVLVNLRPYEITPGAKPSPPPKTDPGKEPPKEPPKETPDPVALAREMKRKAASKNNLFQLARALRSYVDAFQTLPPPAIYGTDGTPLLSWRVALLPFLGQQKLYDRFKRDEPWDSPANRDLLQFMPKEFILPDTPLKDPNTTYYQLFVGPGAYEPGAKRRTIMAIPDGPSHTIAIAEGSEPVPWTAPVDLPYSPDGPLPKLGGPFADGFHAALFDGSAQFFKKEIYADDKALRALIGWNDGEVVNLRPYRESPPLPPKDSPAHAAAESVRRINSSNNLKQLAFALHNYHDANRAFPPYAIINKEGKPLLSWRVALLPFLDENLLYKKFKLDEPWDGPNNKALLPLMPRSFEAPGAEADQADKTFYQVFVGPGAGFERDPTHRVRFSDLLGGSSNTLAVVEGGEAVPWTKPDDLFFDADKPLPRLGGVFPEGFHACMFDGSVHFIGAKIYQDEKALRGLIDIRGEKKVDIESYR